MCQWKDRRYQFLHSSPEFSVMRRTQLLHYCLANARAHIEYVTLVLVAHVREDIEEPMGEVAFGFLIVAVRGGGLGDMEELGLHHGEEGKQKLLLGDLKELDEG